MLKKIISSALLVGSMFLPAYVHAQTSTDPESSTYEVVGEQGAQTELTGDWTPSEEVNTVEASELTRKAIQAEKARNAAENDRFGGAVTIIAMTIVLSALAILSLLFMGFGKITIAIHSHNKRKAHGVTRDDAETHHEETDSGETIAAIAMALAEHSGQGHDMEDTILTIRRMRKAYSPWNSKIYNMRNLPVIDNRNADHHRTLK